ncbi:MAG: hypothetical protein IJ928_06000 [Prevotella sp.]|nr:hypothetical protein [Prevotella sp.]
MTKVKTKKSQTPYYIYAGAHVKGNEVTTSGTGTIATPPQQKGQKQGKTGEKIKEKALHKKETPSPTLPSVKNTE